MAVELFLPLTPATVVILLVWYTTKAAAYVVAYTLIGFWKAGVWVVGAMRRRHRQSPRLTIGGSR